MKTEIIRRHQVVIHPIPVPLQGQTVAGPVEVAVVAGLHPIGSQQVQNGLAAVAGVAGGVVEEAELLPVPGRFEGGLQPLEFSP